MSDNIYDFGLRLKDLRERKGFSQSDLARKVNVKPATISGYERNVKTPSLDVFIELVRMLDTTPNYLLGFDNKNLLIFLDLSIPQSEFLTQIKEKLIEHDLTNKD